jgi:hypothetical protein
MTETRRTHLTARTFRDLNAMCGVHSMICQGSPYGIGGTSNSVPAATLTLAGIPFRMPSCAFGAYPFNLSALGNKAPVPIGSVPKPNFP